MKNNVFIGIVVLLIALQATANERINVLWIGNSLTGQGICDVGDFQLQWYVNGCKEGCDTAKPSPTGVILASGDALLGATTLAQHWSYGTGLKAVNGLPYVGGGEMVRDPLGWGSVSVDHYDYVILQPWAMLGPANIATESTAFGHYCDTMLALGVKPVIFGLYQEHDSTTVSFDEYTNLYDSLYNLYKGRGALIAPVWRAYRKAWNVLGPVCLFVSGDVYGHESAMGVFLNHCVFYDVFTRHRSSNIDWNLSLTQCPNLMAVDTGHADLTAQVGTLHSFLEAKADEAVSEYYTLSGSTATAHPSPLAAGAGMPAAAAAKRFDLAGKAVGQPVGTKMHGVFVVRRASGATIELEFKDNR
jgi:hypothetical protein